MKDPIDDEIARAMADPRVRDSLERFRRRMANGRLSSTSNDEEARRILGLPYDDSDVE